MLHITTTVLPATDTKGTRVLAMGKGKQRTLPYDHSVPHDVNLARPVGEVLAKVLTPEQRAKLLHPSGAQRVRVEHTGYNTFRYNINV